MMDVRANWLPGTERDPFTVDGPDVQY